MFWYSLVGSILILGIIFAIMYVKDFVKHNEKWEVLLQGMDESKAKRYIFIIALVGGILLFPLAWYWLFVKLFIKEKNDE